MEFRNIFVKNKLSWKNFTKKIVKFLNKKIDRQTFLILRNIFISFLTTIGTLVIVFLLFIQNKDLLISFVEGDKTEDTIVAPLAIDIVPELDKEIIAEEKKEEPKSVIDIAKEANPKVVSIVVSKLVPKYIRVLNFDTGKFEQVDQGLEERKVGEGSGFFISANGTIVTNRHVIEGENLVYKVYTNDGVERSAVLLAKDPVYDVAILKVDGSKYPYFELANSDALSVGQSVVAIGNALGEFKNSVSVGVVSGLSRSVVASTNNGGVEKLEKVIQTDAAINPGNSGGPLIDLYGKVVGINVAVARGSENIGFALPINSVKDVISSVVKTGKITRPYMGVRYVSLNKSIQESQQLPVGYGILLLSGAGENEPAVVPGSPADRAGLKEKDIITFIDGKKITENDSFALIIRDKKVGNTVELSVLRGTEVKTIYVLLDKALD